MGSRVALIFFTLFWLVVANFAQAWEVDLSRRQKRMPQSSAPAKLDHAPETPQEPSRSPLNQSRLNELVSRVKGDTAVDRQEVVILNTSRGFVPNNIRIHKGVHYTVHVVNVNPEKKNVSFMLDAFSQHHATYYGVIKTFYLDPEKEGVYQFQCPETSYQGKLVVFGPGSASPVNRVPASE